MILIVPHVAVSELILVRIPQYNPEKKSTHARRATISPNRIITQKLVGSAKCSGGTRWLPEKEMGISRTLSCAQVLTVTLAPLANL